MRQSRRGAAAAAWGAAAGCSRVGRRTVAPAARQHSRGRRHKRPAAQPHTILVSHRTDGARPGPRREPARRRVPPGEPPSAERRRTMAPIAGHRRAPPHPRPCCSRRPCRRSSRSSRRLAARPPGPFGSGRPPVITRQCGPSPLAIHFPAGLPKPDGPKTTRPIDSNLGAKPAKPIIARSTKAL